MSGLRPVSIEVWDSASANRVQAIDIEEGWGVLWIDQNGDPHALAAPAPALDRLRREVEKMDLDALNPEINRREVLDVIDRMEEGDAPAPALDAERLARAIRHMDIIDYSTEPHGYTFSTPEEAAAAIAAEYAKQEKERP